MLEHRTSVMLDKRELALLAPSPKTPSSNIQTTEMGSNNFRKCSDTELVWVPGAKHFTWDRVSKATITFSPREMPDIGSMKKQKQAREIKEL